MQIFDVDRRSVGDAVIGQVGNQNVTIPERVTYRYVVFNNG